MAESMTGPSPADTPANTAPPDQLSRLDKLLEPLKLDEVGSVLEKVVGKRQSIIFSLIALILVLAKWNMTDLAMLAMGYLGIIVKGYVDDVTAEKAA